MQSFPSVMSLGIVRWDSNFIVNFIAGDCRWEKNFIINRSAFLIVRAGSRARDIEGGEDGDDTGREDGGDDTSFGRFFPEMPDVHAAYKKKICRLFPSDMSLGKGDSKRLKSRGASVDKSTNIKVTPSDMSLGKLPLKDKTVEVKSVEKIVAGERFVIELTQSMFPHRHVAGDRFPQRHVAVADEGVRMLLGKGLITVVARGNTRVNVILSKSFLKVNIVLKDRSKMPNAPKNLICSRV
ncbi:hypothetical protein Tco_1318598 [Tanacetum coccineum]